MCRSCQLSDRLSESSAEEQREGGREDGEADRHSVACPVPWAGGLRPGRQSRFVVRRHAGGHPHEHPMFTSRAAVPGRRRRRALHPVGNQEQGENRQGAGQSQGCGRAADTRGHVSSVERSNRIGDPLRAKDAAVR